MKHNLKIGMGLAALVAALGAGSMVLRKVAVVQASGTMAPRFEELGVGAEEFLPFVRSCFAQKRKMLGKNLRNAGFEPSAIAAGFEGCGISAQVRAEEVGLEGMACLFRRLAVAR